MQHSLIAEKINIYIYLYSEPEQIIQKKFQVSEIIHNANKNVKLKVF